MSKETFITNTPARGVTGIQKCYVIKTGSGAQLEVEVVLQYKSSDGEQHVVEFGTRGTLEADELAILLRQAADILNNGTFGE